MDTSPLRQMLSELGAAASEDKPKDEDKGGDKAKDAAPKDDKAGKEGDKGGDKAKDGKDGDKPKDGEKGGDKAAAGGAKEGEKGKDGAKDGGDKVKAAKPADKAAKKAKAGGADGKCDDVTIEQEVTRTRSSAVLPGNPTTNEIAAVVIQFKNSAGGGCDG